MNKKLTFPELAELLSAATNTSKRMSELALREIFAIISQSLVDGENVKIQDIGTFKVTGVNPRKSVDVNTGKAIEIPGHNKVTFTPDKRLAEAVNASFSAFESVVLDDDVTVQMLGEIDSSVETSTSVDDVSQEPVNEAEQKFGNTMMPPTDEGEQVAVQPQGAEQPVVSEINSESDDEETEQPEQETGAASNDEKSSESVEDGDNRDGEQEASAVEQAMAVQSENAIGEEPVAEPMETPRGAEMVENEDSSAIQEPEVQNKEEEGLRTAEPTYDDYDDEDEVSWWSRHKTLMGFVCGTIFGVCLCILWGFVQKYMEGDNDKTEYNDNSEVVLTDTFVENIDTATYVKTDSLLAASGKKATEQAQVDDIPAKSAEVLDTVTATNFLTRMARRHYGNNHFWVYIYEENKSKISNPNNVRPGTVLVIPDAKKYGIDKDDEESVKKAIKKEGEIQSKYI